jgi:dATP pyrophosphohydrolase
VTRIRKSIECWLVTDTHALLLHLPGNEEAAGFWQPITGGIEQGEEPPNAAVREVFEETGIVIERGGLHFCGEGIMVEISAELTIEKSLFFAPILLEQVRLNSEHDAYQYVTIDRVESWLSWQSQKETWRTVLASTGSNFRSVKLPGTEG